MPQWSLQRDDGFPWRLSLFSYHKSKTIFIRTNTIAYSSKGSLFFFMLSQRYEPHCPSRACTGGHKNKLYRIRGNPIWLTRKVWVKKKRAESLYRCAHCGLVWLQKNSTKLGLDARPVGYYDDFDHPWEFVFLKHRYRIREQNTSRYWYNKRRKAIRAPRCGGVDWGAWNPNDAATIRRMC